jgi:hypothetical protein
MFMRHPSYLDEDSGSQAIAGESSRILEQSWNNPKIVSQTVSPWLPHFPNSLLQAQLELEARVGIGQFTPLLHPKYTRFHWLLNINRHNPTIPFLTPLVSVLVSARRTKVLK